MTKKKPGLVICAITNRSEEGPRYASLREIDKALVPLTESNRLPAESEYSVEFSPACIRVSKRRKSSAQGKSSPRASRKSVTTWSNKSRLKMLERFASLDYSPFIDDKFVPALLTLTYPSEWLSVVPTAHDAKKHLQNFRKRFERTYGRTFHGLWKMEFQRRGAPHFHILAPIPIGVRFPEWLSLAWSEVVNHQDSAEREKHRLAGTRVDLARGLTATDANLISFYFSKHSSAGYGPKEYQHFPPEEWQREGSVGRFWGYWGLSVATRKLLLNEKEALFIARTLKRWQKSKRKVVKTRVRRLNMETGEVSYRYVNRKQKMYRSAQAMRLISDGVSFAEVFARYLGDSEHSS